MSKLQPARGTRDLYGDDMRRMSHVIDSFKSVGASYGFEEIAPPIFEFTDVFKRPLGEASDIVSKEMYSFQDRGGEDLTLRPEFTAGVCRAFISNGMQQTLPCRLMSAGPAFRYERPQKGRYRQFHQINAELLGAADPLSDVDLIAMAWRLLTRLEISDGALLHLNSLGDKDSRAAHRDALVAYLSRFRNDLSEDSQRRLEINPLRILDSKDEGDQALLQEAPSLADYLNDPSRQFFDQVQNGLTKVGVPYKLTPGLVRGLDYYTHTCFEFITDRLGAQGTLLAGGRYDGLIKQLGGPDTPGVGWAGGIERLAMMLAAAPDQAKPLIVMPMGDQAQLEALKVAETLRGTGYRVTSDRSGNLGKRLTRAAKAGAAYAIILGDEEISAGMVQVKNLETGDQQKQSLSDLVEQLSA